MAELYKMSHALLTILLCCFVAVPASVVKSLKCEESLVNCATVECEDGAALVTPEGKCCPECVPRKVPTASSPCDGVQCEGGAQPLCCPPTCPPLTCPDGVQHVPQGECCPVCGLDCGGVTCPNVDCSHGHWIQFPEYCCPICFTPATTTSSSTVAGTSPITATTNACPELDCDIGLEFPEGEPCPVCAEPVTRPDCGGVTCPPLDCPVDGSTLPEYCCPVCMTTNLPEPPENCTQPCDTLSCTYGVYRPALACCNACMSGPEDPPANCQTVTCPFVDCVGGLPMTSPGDCCVSCAFP